MTIKRYRIQTPEQLREVSEFCQRGELGCRSRATVWSTERRRRGSTPWDDSFYVRFMAERCGIRKAHIYSGGMMLAEVKYNAALAYCRDNLELIEEVAG